MVRLVFRKSLLLSGFSRQVGQTGMICCYSPLAFYSPLAVMSCASTCRLKGIVMGVHQLGKRVGARWWGRLGKERL